MPTLNAFDAPATLEQQSLGRGEMLSIDQWEIPYAKMQVR
jgi:hypothetical protein